LLHQRPLRESEPQQVTQAQVKDTDMATIPSLMKPPATPDPTNLFATGGAPVGYQMGANFLENQQREAFNNQALDLIRQGNIGTLAATREEIAREGRGDVLDLAGTPAFANRVTNYADFLGRFAGLNEFGLGDNLLQSVDDRARVAKRYADITNTLHGNTADLLKAGGYQPGQPIASSNIQTGNITGVDFGPDPLHYNPYATPEAIGSARPYAERVDDWGNRIRMPLSPGDPLLDAFNIPGGAPGTGRYGSKGPPVQASEDKDNTQEQAKALRDLQEDVVVTGGGRVVRKVRSEDGTIHIQFVFPGGGSVIYRITEAGESTEVK
jgi:hypothetical protein